MLNRYRLRRVVWLPALVANPLASQTPTRTADTLGVIAIRAGRLIDGRGGAPVSNAVILVRGDRIQAVGANLAIPAGARVIDLSSATVLPGLIDCHTHITSAPGASDDQFRRSFVDAAIMAPTYAKATLDAGFTTIRDLGASDFVDVALRNAINRGDIPGPRIQAATMAISATGGHGDVNGLSCGDGKSPPTRMAPKASSAPYARVWRPWTMALSSTRRPLA